MNAIAIGVPASSKQRQPSRFELRFQSLFHSGKALIFPCDENGSVFLDLLSDKARANYLFARAVVGHEYANPVVLASD